jgi:hypothetical protein
MSDDPVFILGPERSGTTILYRTLQLQERFALGPGRRGGEGEVDLTESRLLTRAWWLFDLEQEEARTARQFLLFDPAAIARVVEAAGRVPRWRRAFLRGPEDWYPWIARRLRRRVAWRLSGAGAVLRTYFDAAREARGVARVVEKTPRHDRFLPAIRATFPRAPVILCVRHPVDAYASMLRRKRRRESLGIAVRTHRIFRRSPEEFAGYWRRSVRRGLRERRARPDALRFVRYEDLTADPEKTLLALGDFLGERFDPARLPGAMRSGWQLEEDPWISRPIRREAPDWRESLSEDAAREIDDRLAEERAALGYPPATETRT